jgi:hypothetical protein
LYPTTFEELLASHDKLTVCPAVVPTPVRDSVLEDGDASLVNVNVPLSEPMVSGLNVTVYEAVFPAAIVTGKESPPTVKRELLLVAAITVTLAPIALRLPAADPVLPTVTFPTATVVGVTLSCPEVAVAVPVPDNAIDKLEFDAPDPTDTLPVVVPADLGLNTTLKDVLCPGASVSGRVRPLTLNAVPVTGAWVMVRLAPPTLMSVADLVELVSSFTVPKFRLVDEELSAAGLVVEGLPELNPWHPIRAHRMRMVGRAIPALRVDIIKHDCRKWLISNV